MHEKGPGQREGSRLTREGEGGRKDGTKWGVGVFLHEFDAFRFSGGVLSTFLFFHPRPCPRIRSSFSRQGFSFFPGSSAPASRFLRIDGRRRISDRAGLSLEGQEGEPCPLRVVVRAFGRGCSRRGGRTSYRGPRPASPTHPTKRTKAPSPGPRLHRSPSDNSPHTKPPQPLIPVPASPPSHPHPRDASPITYTKSGTRPGFQGYRQGIRASP